MTCFEPLLPPDVLIHYKDFDLGCSMIDNVCEYIERRSGYDAYEIAYLYPQLLPKFLIKAEFCGERAREWQRFVSDELTPASIKWHKRGPCPGLAVRCPISHRVFLMSSKRAYKYLRECTYITSAARELGIQLWRYGPNKRVVTFPIERPIEKIRAILSYAPIKLEDAVNCGKHGLASLIYWAENFAVKSIELLIDSLIKSKFGFTQSIENGYISHFRNFV
ncbi:hypothetical protein [Pyrobaculum aerophilum]|uniref:Uncharacterized protein n=1 Tax=Pyrobaculum aerophilum TaxID=13773 RepID=A0A371QX67_9CREN|nr:hypothetical protein [Pyrobaculum aerophilum]RFA95025.1 hypothetical protein CGL51_08560 [Pyrobaculum aerophilum]RFA96739.1 hypothetical protein CGL52_10595 [Pyrobaculum aerophilum]